MMPNHPAPAAPEAPETIKSVGDVVNYLRTAIVSLALAPGTPIRQEDMARRLGISRVPLREALRVLTSEGLVTHRPNHGYFVTRLERAELEQAYSLLEFLSVELVRTARWPTDDEIDELRSINAQFEEVSRKGDFVSANTLNDMFHQALFLLSPLDLYRQEADRFWGLSGPYRLVLSSTENHARAGGQHEAIIDAFAARDRALCLRLHSEHGRDSRMAVLQTLPLV